MPVVFAAATYLFIGTMGQSVAIGAHSNQVLTAAPPYPAQALMLNDSWGTRGPGAYLYSAFQNAGVTALVAAHEALGPTPPLDTATGYAETHVTSMLAQQIFEGSRNPLIGRSDGTPGRLLADLSKGTSYLNAKQDLTAANTLVARAGGRLIEPAVAFIEGQSDRLNKTDAAAYCSQSDALAKVWNSDVVAITGQTVPVLFFQMQLGAPHAGAGDIATLGSLISECQLDLALTNKLFRLAAPSYMLPFTLNGTVHPDAPSQRLQGEYLGKAMYQEIQLHKPWMPLSPFAVTFNALNRSKIEVTFRVPVGSIVRDTVHMPQGAAPADGFTFHDACNDATVVSDKITGPRTIEIQLSAVPACANPTLNYAFDYMPGSRPSTLPSSFGNIRDSDETKGWAGDTLYNWLTVFSKPVITPPVSQRPS